jgi:capsular polysaccharide biosynthesis protein
VEFRAYARILLRRWWLLIALAAIAGVTAYSYAVRSASVYRAVAHLSVTPTSIDFYKGEAVQRLLNNYSLQMRTRDFAARVAARLPAPEPSGSLEGKIRAVAAPSEYRIGIEVDDAEPVRAQVIANTAAEAFLEKLNREASETVRLDVQVQVLERAETPSAPIRPRPMRDALGAALLGGLLGAGLAFLLEYWDDKVKTSDEAKRLLDLPVLGTIPRIRKDEVRYGLSRLRGDGATERDRVHPAALAGRGGVSDPTH